MACRYSSARLLAYAPVKPLSSSTTLNASNASRALMVLTPSSEPGDLAFWAFFPRRINEVGREIKATTMMDIVVDGMKPQTQSCLKRAVAVVIMICLGGYVSAQWIAGEKFLRGAFGVGGATSLLAFATLIIAYTAIGGFRGSVYVDSMQAIIRLIGTLIAITAVVRIALQDSVMFWRNIRNAGADFMQFFPHGSALATLPFVIGFAAAAAGFGLGQPQMITRYIAGASPKETTSAWWIYNLFVQFTWLSMIIFGILLRGVMPAIDDPEMGLSLFFRSNTGPILTGLITADIFATIAATSNSLLIATAQTASHDLLERPKNERDDQLWLLTAFVGVVTMVFSLSVRSSVFNLVLSSASLLGAGLAPAMLIRLLNWRRTDRSVTLAIGVGFFTAISWRLLGFSGFMNEAAPGMALALLVNRVLSYSWRRQKPPREYETNR
jgi:sodium/proline symporter